MAIYGTHYKIEDWKSALNRKVIEKRIGDHERSISTEIKGSPTAGFKHLEATEFDHPGDYSTVVDCRLPEGESPTGRNRTRLLAERVVLRGVKELIDWAALTDSSDPDGPVFHAVPMADHPRLKITANVDHGPLEGVALFDASEDISKRIDEAKDALSQLGSPPYELAMVNFEKMTWKEVSELSAAGCTPIAMPSGMALSPGSYLMLVHIHSPIAHLYTI
jgi:hypothetical protein